MDAIIYESNTGFTKKYAELLSAKTGLPIYERKKTPSSVLGKDIIYMGWLCAGIISGFKKAGNKYHIKAVCAVGMTAPDEKLYSDTAKQNLLADTKLYLLRGGFDIKKLHGFYRFMMKLFARSLTESIEKKEDKTEDDLLTLEMLRTGKDMVDGNSLIPLINDFSL